MVTELDETARHEHGPVLHERPVADHDPPGRSRHDLGPAEPRVDDDVVPDLDLPSVQDARSAQRPRPRAHVGTTPESERRAQARDGLARAIEQAARPGRFTSTDCVISPLGTLAMSARALHTEAHREAPRLPWVGPLPVRLYGTV